MNKLYKHQQEIRKLCKKDRNISEETKAELLSIVSHTYNDGMEIGWEARDKDDKKCRFNIDFFEFAFLVEACIPPRPIARSMFWHEVIDKYYHLLTPDEREKLFDWINRNPSFQDGLESGNEDCRLFFDRYNPANQYIITIVFEGEEEERKCFMHNGRYYTSRQTFVSPEYITKIEKNENRE